MIDLKVLWSLLVAAVVGPLPGALARSPAEDAEAFEKEIRPLLIENCGKCHGAEKQKAGLRVDSRKALAEGGESGPSIVPGHPDEEPPDRRGPAIGRAADAARPEAPRGAGRRPRALGRGRRPLASRRPGRRPGRGGPPSTLGLPAGRDPAPPPVRRPDWCRTPIDAFVLARLEAAGLEPSPPADRRTLIRRASYDLTGLPPTPEEVEAFVADPDPDAFARVVDRLLASPHHGEQWARHWLDVARYSDTKGYVYAREERFFVQAPAYRDWVVKAFNDDMPYDRFLLHPDGRRSGRAGGSVGAGGDGLPDPRPPLPRRDPRHHRRPDRRRDPRDDGPDRRLRPLPRPQVRPDPDGRLLLALRGLPELHRAAGADRRARSSRDASRRRSEKELDRSARGPAAGLGIEPGRGVASGPAIAGRLPDGAAGPEGDPGGRVRRRPRQGRPDPGLRPPMEGLPGRLGEGRRPDLPPLATVRRNSGTTSSPAGPPR